MRILFVTDSLALPRDKPEVLSYESTYPQLIKKEIPSAEIQQLSIGGATIDELNRASKYYTSFKPDVVIVQSGIVDCAPRTMTKFGRQFWSKIPLLGKGVLAMVSSNAATFRKLRNTNYTKPKDFVKWLSRLNETLADAKIIHIAIMPSSDAYEQKLPGVTSRIEQYNALLAANSSKIIGQNMTTDMLMSDHHHLNTKGHQALANDLVVSIKEINLSD